MISPPESLPSRSRLAALPDHFPAVEGPRDAQRETDHFDAPRALSAADAATAVREHCSIENRLHRVLDLVCLRKGHGARKLSPIRRFALNLVRTPPENRSIKAR